MDEERFKELLKSLGIKDKKEGCRTIDKNLSQAELKKRLGKIIYSIASNEE